LFVSGDRFESPSEIRQPLAARGFPWPLAALNFL